MSEEKVTLEQIESVESMINASPKLFSNAQERRELQEYYNDLTKRYKVQLKEAEGTDKALKYDVGKTDWCILPFLALEEIVKVLKFGENKYARGNFASNGGLSYTRLINALLRHTLAFARGEDKDPESGLHHMAHAGACVIFLLHYITHDKDFTASDDREKQILK